MSRRSWTLSTAFIVKYHKLFRVSSPILNHSWVFQQNIPCDKQLIRSKKALTFWSCVDRCLECIEVFLVAYLPVSIY
jgi:hypothetical protein